MESIIGRREPATPRESTSKMDKDYDRIMRQLRDSDREKLELFPQLTCLRNLTTAPSSPNSKNSPPSNPTLAAAEYAHRNFTR